MVRRSAGGILPDGPSPGWAGTRDGVPRCWGSPFRARRANPRPEGRTPTRTSPSSNNEPIGGRIPHAERLTDIGPLAAELVRAVELLTEAFRAKGTRYAVIGGLGVILRGRPRFTQDVDVLLDVPQLALPGLLGDLAEHGFDIDAPQAIMATFATT